MVNQDLKFISKKMSYALRHNPDKYGIQLDEYGYTDLPTFIKALNRVHHFHPALTKAKIEEVMVNADKQRFEIKSNRICALYGHSIPGIIKHQPATPPAVLYHGTARRFIPSIEKLGLLPMQRQFVHLSTDLQTAYQVGSRHDAKPVILQIDAAAAHQAGIQFYVGNDQVWLCDELPARFFKILKKN
ncbi:RNA 2'-phosphotransferase [Limosilactobacillus viscerum]|uniref:RNA 2'-phosphotransferase n=1 Tax=Limosilactobacillus viscerum TaxID=2993450 RepID=UPI0024BBDEE9|nr:RNA 2'-phosphotransferase [Limosilactobacillus viscerum]